MRSFFETWLVPRDGVEFLMADMGFLFGLFFVFSASNSGQEPKKFWQRTRFQALLWLFGAGMTSAVLDWKGLTLDPTLDKGHLVAVYGGWTATTVITLLFLGVIAVVIEGVLLARTRPRFPAAIFDLAIRFVTNGWADYQNRKEALLGATAADAELRRSQEEAQERLTAELLSKLSIQLLRDLDASDSHYRAEIAEKILEAIRAEILKFAPLPKPQLRLNYLAVKPFSAVPADHHARVKFTFGDFARYTEALILRYRLGEPAGPAIVLPVDNHIDSPDTLLPGAPECVGLRKFTSLPTRGNGLNFRKGVPEAIRQQIRDYFARLPDFDGGSCQNVVSIRLFVRDATVGVLNIESSAADMVGLGSESVGKIVASIEPFCFQLACVVRRDERDRGYEA